MAGACPVSLSVAVANTGSMGALGALMHTPAGIRDWVREFRDATTGPLQINTWIPDPPPVRDSAAEARMREFLATWGPAGGGVVDHGVVPGVVRLAGEVEGHRVVRNGDDGGRGEARA